MENLIFPWLLVLHSQLHLLDISGDVRIWVMDPLTTVLHNLYGDKLYSRIKHRRHKTVHKRTNKEERLKVLFSLLSWSSTSLFSIKVVLGRFFWKVHEGILIYVWQNTFGRYPFVHSLLGVLVNRIESKTLVTSNCLVTVNCFVTSNCLKTLMVLSVIRTDLFFVLYWIETYVRCSYFEHSSRLFAKRFLKCHEETLNI